MSFHFNGSYFPLQRINDLKAKLDPVGLYFKRQNGTAFTQAPAASYMVANSLYNGGNFIMKESARQSKVMMTNSSLDFDFTSNWMLDLNSARKKTE